MSPALKEAMRAGRAAALAGRRIRSAPYPTGSPLFGVWVHAYRTAPRRPVPSPRPGDPVNDLSDMALATIAKARRLAHERGSTVVETQDLRAALEPPRQPPAASKWDGVFEWDQ